MASEPDIRAKLRTLSIPKDQRPMSARAPSAAPSKLPRQLAIGFAVVAVLAGGIWAVTRLAGRSGSAAEAQIRVMTVTQREAGQPMPVSTATGKIVSDHKVLVNTKVSGQIIELMFEQGDRVKKGQVLARIEDVLYRARRDEAAAQLEEARANLAYQKVNFERIARLYEASTAPEIEYIGAKKDIESAQARVTASESTLTWTQKALTDCEVVAPIEGVILERNVEVGDFVAAEGGRGAIANAQLCSIADMSKLRVEVDISELDIARIHTDMPCVITPDAYKDRRYEGHVMWLDPGANYSKATVQVKVRIKNPDPNLRVEGSAQVQFLSEPATTDATGGIWIPTSACLREAGNTRVFVVSEGRLQETPITTGRQIGNQIEVLSGLSSGQSIAVSEPEKLSDGQRVAS